CSHADSNRNLNPDSSATVWLGDDADPAINGLHSLFHSDQSETSLCLPGAVKAGAIILHDDVDQVSIGMNSNQYISGIGVAGAVGKRFLDDAINAGTLRVREFVQDTLDLHGGRNAGVT